jgi:deoxyribodipyrimidine photolyase-related protein
VRREFPDHPGDPDDFWLPTNRKQALAWLDDFLEYRFADFGPYEDAIHSEHAIMNHSVLTPALNLGLLTPDEVVEKALAHKDLVPLASLEGFVRQVIGWREFVRGIYRGYPDQGETNFWNHTRKLGATWYTGETGLEPLDLAIKRTLKRGYNHHIERLMVIGNVMLLCEVHPKEAHRWFMELYVDSSDWVMGPNVYGMSQMSDGDVFATKPYICGSSYILKMSDLKKGFWCDIMDGLYWRFIERHRDYFARNPRLAVMPKALDRLDPERKKRIFAAAEAFLRKNTVY